MGMNPASAGGPGTDNAESGGATTTSGGRTVTGTGWGPGPSVNPHATTAGETFDSGIHDVLADDDIGDDGNVVTSTGYPVSPSANSADHGSPGSIPDVQVINRGYLNSKTPLPTPTRKGTQRQSY